MSLVRNIPRAVEFMEEGLTARPVLKLEDIPMEMAGKTLPASEYAVSRTAASWWANRRQSRNTYAYAYGTWLPQSGFENLFGFDFEFYGDRFHGNQDPNSEIEVWLPIQKK
jgi:AraC family transcriptional regulator